MPTEGQTGTAPDGTPVVFRGGRVITQVEDQWGPGARTLPNGSVVRYGPRGGMQVLSQGGGGAGSSIGPANKPTEDMGKAQGYARMMQNAERNYDNALSQGYNPGSVRNSLASMAEGLPFGGLDGLGAAIRDPVSDRGRQAELQWSDAQLKAVSGAASPEAEVKRGVRTFFARPGENLTSIEPQKRAAREVAFSAAKTRAGPYGADIGGYPRNDVPQPARDTFRRMMSQGRLDPKAPFGSEKNPYIVTSQQADRLPKGSHVVLEDGSFGVVE